VPRAGALDERGWAFVRDRELALVQQAAVAVNGDELAFSEFVLAEARRLVNEVDRHLATADHGDDAELAGDDRSM
jgi:hypothetical protein